MKRQQVKNTLQLKKATIVKFSKLQKLIGGVEERTGESCFKVCDTNIQNCSWGNV